MHTVLDKDTIEMEITPHIPLPKWGFPPTFPLVEIVNAILYKLKTGVQWHQLPTRVFFEERALSWESVCYHYRKWCVNGVWKACWIGILDKHRSSLGLSSVDLVCSSMPMRGSMQNISGHLAAKRALKPIYASTNVTGIRIRTNILTKTYMTKYMPLNAPVHKWQFPVFTEQV